MAFPVSLYMFLLEVAPLLATSISANSVKGARARRSDTRLLRVEEDQSWPETKTKKMDAVGGGEEHGEELKSSERRSSGIASSIEQAQKIVVTNRQGDTNTEERRQQHRGGSWRNEQSKSGMNTSPNEAANVQSEITALQDEAARLRQEVTSLRELALLNQVVKTQNEVASLRGDQLELLRKKLEEERKVNQARQDVEERTYIKPTSVANIMNSDPSDPIGVINDVKYAHYCKWWFGMRQGDCRADCWKHFTEKVREGDFVCIQGDYPGCAGYDLKLPPFFDELFPNLTTGINLMTLESDCPQPPPQYAKHLDSPKILAWFAWNLGNIKHPKLFDLPIGVSSEMTLRRKLNRALHSLKEAIEHNKTQKRLDRVFINFNTEHGPTNHKDQFIRQHLWNLSANWSFADRYPYPMKEDTFETMLKYKFVACPRGAGEDTHRVWEALYMGAFPIVVAPGEMSNRLSWLYGSLPVIKLDKWEDLPLRIHAMRAIPSFNPFEMPELTSNGWLKKLKLMSKSLSS